MDTFHSHLLDRAICIASEAHSGQTRWDGSPYILHPLRVMAAVESPQEKIVAVLHDVVEDTEVTFSDLAAEGFSNSLLVPLRILTREDEDDYETYIEDIKPHHLAREVKKADLRDNLNVLEVPLPLSRKQCERLKKYQKAYRFLAE